MTYNAAIPQASDTISASQPPILTNFFELNTVFGIDHVKFDDATLANRGHHLKVTFNDVLGADPGLLAPACSLYTKATGAGNQLFFQNAVNIVQLTGSVLADSGNDGFGGSYQMFQTPWGIRCWVGQLQPFVGARNYTLSGASSFGPAVYTAQISAFGGGPKATSITPTAGANTFNAQMGAPGAQPAWWFVITA